MLKGKKFDAFTLFGTLEHKFETLEHKFDTLEHKFDSLEHRFLQAKRNIYLSHIHS